MYLNTLPHSIVAPLLDKSAATELSIAALTSVCELPMRQNALGTDLLELFGPPHAGRCGTRILRLYAATRWRGALEPRSTRSHRIRGVAIASPDCSAPQPK